MDIFEPSVDEEVDLVNLQATSQTPSESYHVFIRQQHNQRERDRYNRLQIERVDLRKRINNRISFGENSLDLVEMHESTTHHEFEASTSNQRTIDNFNSELEGSSNLLNVPSTSYVLPPCIDCKYCGARKFFRESKGFCYSDRKVKLFMPESPTELYTLFTSKELICMEFKKIAREYNNHFAFTSFGVKYDKELFKTYRGIYTFRVQEQVYHYVNQLMPENNLPSYMQLYFYDTDNELQNRMNISENFVESTLILLMQILTINPYSRFFRSLSNIPNL
ncbi:uncharacterized protein LOC111402304 [Olea europaea var. sylvestris]|uniref:uncharacterized protein LOC111402304 n=1 Tax=Olea europaea var. sylvestris TaxID=158386 RepID=UPI000C1D8330|nr:uncharacterized protein LOC111402304 [Olea europaea var. sylvestris]XP_022886288.1 uncharacterized protein LOC111402304 [Olea europaea var. sylvestris]XP_022886289.1 uncharacterized protein LOC111402304 [Olea europaea var. sylvestris]